jgi:hypothetical protein
MAEVNILRIEAKRRHLPPVCMVCGARARSYVLRYFNWQPIWVLVTLVLGFVQLVIVAIVSIVRHAEMREARGVLNTISGWVCFGSLALAFLPFLAVLFSTKRARLHAPLCAAHRRHWSNRGLVLGLSFGFVALATIGSFLWATAAVQPGAGRLAGLFCLGSAVLLAAWCVLAVVLQATAIRPVAINAAMVRLTNVSPHFADALLEAPTYEDDAVVEGIVIEDEPRPTPLPPDAFEEEK